ncbi:hypothetical protein [Sphingopyxis alaskensis]|uniref:hypothetical protein n=1 Tax=Sphingopyxis alaskensis TaxID=117207 RepID=UPI00203E070C|nr:hypothetical protein [Sphingopyxis alaskensis]MCM3420151.1 hypothetical protein [Sphingopyxis alaskensis]
MTMQMRFPLDKKGNPTSHFIIASAGRRLALGKDGDAHVIQSIISKWHDFSFRLAEFSKELEVFESLGALYKGEIAKHFKDVNYSATELFDVYSIMIPSRLNNCVPKSILRDYRETSKSRRDLAAKICNASKHGATELQKIWVASHHTSTAGSRIRLCKYVDGEALDFHPDVHDKKTDSFGIVRFAQELVHNLLRLDLLAANLIKKLPDQECVPVKEVTVSLEIGESIRRLEKLIVTHIAGQTPFYDGFKTENESIILKRSKSQQIIEPTRWRLSLRYQAGTDSYQIFQPNG